MINAFDILKQLVDLKKERNANGKTPAYKMQKEALWEKAFDFVENRQRLKIHHRLRDYSFNLDDEFNQSYKDERDADIPVQAPSYELSRYFKYGYMVSEERLLYLEAALIKAESALSNYDGQAKEEYFNEKKI